MDTTWSFETLGNAMIQFFQGETPVLVTDPWLEGTAYFGSWALERPLTPRQIGHAGASRYVWFSHGHPDHFHPPSFRHLSKSQLMLLPRQYNNELEVALNAEGFQTRVLPDKEWVTLEPGLRVLCLGNENMDAILAVEAGGVLVLNKNDSPFCGEEPFFRRLVQGYKDSYLLCLCAYDADMINIFDADMRPLIGDPEDRRPGVVHAVGRMARYLGAKNFACSSSQHIYARPDSAWANDYRVSWADIQRLWTAPDVRPIGPYSHVDLATGEARFTDGQTPPLEPRIAADNGADDWDAKLSEAEWEQVRAFALQFETLRPYQDFIAFTVGGETRRYAVRPGLDLSRTDLRGANFIVPKHSLMETVEYGYFDDLLIGNFMKTQLFNMALYPHFSPLVAKLGGNAKVFTAAQLRAFRWHYFAASPAAFLRFRWQQAKRFAVFPAARRIAHRLGVFGLVKRIKIALFGGPKTVVR
jgi:hypothetical protein